MSAWAPAELRKVERAEEVDVAPSGPDGAPRKRVTIWAVGHDGAVYIRSAVKGPDAAWYRGALQTHKGRIWAAGLEKDVRFEEADDALAGAIDAAYRAKYRRYAGRILNSCLTPAARSTTLKVVPR